MGGRGLAVGDRGVWGRGIGNTGRGGEGRSICLHKYTLFATKQFVFCSGKMPYSGLGGMEVVDYLKAGHRLKQPDGCSDKM